jgi:diguanylate cyclase (GGDEF)-like protein/PAS domain S-box-containing protein
MSLRRWLLLSAVLLATVAATIVLRSTGGLQLFERATADFGASLLQHEVESNIVIVALDSDSLAQLRQWPWPRRWHARLLDRLREAGAERVFYDIDFSAASTPEDDDALKMALLGWGEKPVILPAFWQWSADKSSLLLTHPLPDFVEHAELGSVNFQPGSDGLVRSVRSSWHIGGIDLPSVLMRLSENATPRETDMAIDFTISPASFEYTSFVDVLNGRIDPGMFENKRVFVGATAVELGDTLAVPVHQSLPGVVVQALAIETMIAGQLSSLPNWATIALVILWAAIFTFLFFLTTWRVGVCLLFVSTLLIVGTSTYLYSSHRLIIESMPFVVSATGAFLLAIFATLDEQKFSLVTFRRGLRKGNALLQSVFKSSTDSIICLNAHGEIQLANSSANHLFRCDEASLEGKAITDLVPTLVPTVRDDDMPDFDALTGTVYEHLVHTIGGAKVPAELTISRVHLEDEALFVVVLRDVSVRKEQERVLRYQANYDSLTDLPNRMALARYLADSIERFDNTHAISLLMLDLDRFKEVNDTLGHGAGDQILCEVGNRFRKLIGEKGFVARIGGDEFAVVLDGQHDHGRPASIARIFIEAMQEPLAARGLSVELGVSIGIARYPRDAGNAETLLQRADVAMYLAKARGTGFEFYNADEDRHTVRKLSLVAELRSAIARDELVLSYQPKIDLRSKRVYGAEALLRWDHMTLGQIRPDEFISMVEATELLRPLTEWTLQQGFQQIAASRNAGLDGSIAVNLSARMLQDRSFPQTLERMISEAGISASDLEIEITESAMMLDPDRALKNIQAIYSLGVKISIDDFGTGYSSLSYLRDLPLQALKIDKSFIMSMRTRKDNRVIVESTLQMAHALGLQVVAEGVETAWEESYLVKCGCDLAQGYLYAPALPSEEYISWSHRFNAAGGRAAIAV